MLVGFRRDLNLKTDFTLRNIARCYPIAPSDAGRTSLEPVVEAKYILTPVL